MSRFDMNLDDKAVQKLEKIHKAFDELSNVIEKEMETVSGRALSLTKLDECFMWMKRAVWFDQKQRSGGIGLPMSSDEEEKLHGPKL